MAKLFVGGLPFEMKEDEFKAAFAEIGEVTSANIISDKFSGRSKGFGFVEYASDEDAKAAIDKLNGSELGGRRITVDEARPQRER